MSPGATAALAVLFHFAASWETIGAELTIARTGASTVGRFDKIEFTIQPSRTYRNPYDPKEIEADLHVASSAGAELRIPAFFCQDYQRRRIARNGQMADWIYPVGRPVWKARFAPLELGEHRACAVFRDADGERRSALVRFEAVASQRKGFVRISKADPRFLELDSGQPLFLIGQNVAFIGSAQYVTPSKAEEIFAKLAQHGANFLRIWTCCEHWATCIEGRKSAWARSWDWKPPVARLPGHEDDPNAPRYVKLAGPLG